MSFHRYPTWGIYPLILLDLGKFGITLEILQTPENLELELKKLSTSPLWYIMVSVVLFVVIDHLFTQEDDNKDMQCKWRIFVYQIIL